MSDIKEACKHCGYVGERECSDDDEHRYMNGATDVIFNICPICKCQDSFVNVKQEEVEA